MPEKSAPVSQTSRRFRQPGELSSTECRHLDQIQVVTPERARL